MTRKPKPESHITDLFSNYHAYSPEGKYAGEVKLTAKRKISFEAAGWKFKRRMG